MDVDEFTDKLKLMLGDMMEVEKEIRPFVIIPSPLGTGFIPASQMPDKDTVFRLIAQLRSKMPLLAFVSESWRVKSKDGKIDCAPKDHRDKEEVLTVVVYHGVHATMWNAHIRRSGGWVGLGEWVKSDNLSGPLAAVPPEWN